MLSEMLFIPDPIVFLIVCPLVFLGGFVDAVAGGGGLISLPAYLIAGLPAHSAIATNKLSSACGSAVAVYRYAKKGYVNWKIAGICIVAAFVGSALGANAALVFSEEDFKTIMLVVLPLTCLYIVFGKGLKETPKEAYGQKKTAVLAALVAFAIGAYDGFYGPGTGTFMLLLLVGMAHMSIQNAQGVAKVSNFTTNIAALLVFLINGKVLLVLGLVAAVFGIAGNYLGTKFFEKYGARSVKPLMVVVVLVFMIKILTE